MSNNIPTIACDQDIPHLSDWLSESCRLINYQAGELSAEALASADALIVRSVTATNADLLKNSSCRWVGSVTAGKNHLDEAYLQASSIAWKHAPGANAPAVCEYVLSALSLAQKNGKLAFRATIGIIGVGEVGTRVVAACEQLGFRVFGYDPPREQREASFHSATWDELVACECLVVCASYTKSGEWPSHELINEKTLKQCTNLRAVINAARGEIIDYKALFSLPTSVAVRASLRGDFVDAATQKTKSESSPSNIKSRIWTCLDVWPNEPAINHKWVAQADIATPHIAGYSVQSKWRLSAMVYDACCEFFNLQKQPINASQTPQQPTSCGLTAGPIDLEKTSQIMKAAIAKENTPAVFHALRKNYPLRSETSPLVRLNSG